MDKEFVWDKKYICTHCGYDGNDLSEDYCTNGIINKTIPEYYKGFPFVPKCKKCGKVLDYKDFRYQDFERYIAKIDDPIVRGKAVIRYYHLDELLKPEQIKNKELEVT